ncbi:MAG: helicase HerA domain-containing protein [Candidatus Odinarchaeota archaeon]
MEPLEEISKSKEETDDVSRNDGNTVSEVILPAEEYRKFLQFSLKHAMPSKQDEKGKEVVGLLLGKFERNLATISEIYLGNEGTVSTVELQDNSFISKAMKDRESKQGGQVEYGVGWIHSHPNMGLFLSSTDLSTHKNYEKLDSRAVALVIDPVLIPKGNSGVKAFKLDKNNPNLYSEISLTVRGISDFKSCYQELTRELSSKDIRDDIAVVEIDSAIYWKFVRTVVSMNRKSRRTGRNRINGLVFGNFKSNSITATHLTVLTSNSTAELMDIIGNAMKENLENGRKFVGWVIGSLGSGISLLREDMSTLEAFSRTDPRSVALIIDPQLIVQNKGQQGSGANVYILAEKSRRGYRNLELRFLGEKAFLEGYNALLNNNNGESHDLSLPADINGVKITSAQLSLLSFILDYPRETCPLEAILKKGFKREFVVKTCKELKPLRLLTILNDKQGRPENLLIMPDLRIFVQFLKEPAHVFRADMFIDEQLEIVESLKQKWLISGGMEKGKRIYYLDITKELKGNLYRYFIIQQVVYHSTKNAGIKSFEIPNKNVTDFLRLKKDRMKFIVVSNKEKTFKLVPYRDVFSYNSYLEVTVTKDGKIYLPPVLKDAINAERSEDVGFFKVDNTILITELEGIDEEDLFESGNQNERNYPLSSNNTIPEDIINNPVLLKALFKIEEMPPEKIAKLANTDVDTVLEKLKYYDIIEGENVPIGAINFSKLSMKGDYCLRIREKPGANKKVDISSLNDLKNPVCVQYVVRNDEIEVFTVLKRRGRQKKSRYLAEFNAFSELYDQSVITNPEPVPEIIYSNLPTRVVYWETSDSSFSLDSVKTGNQGFVDRIVNRLSNIKLAVVQIHLIPVRCTKTKEEEVFRKRLFSKKEKITAIVDYDDVEYKISFQVLLHDKLADYYAREIKNVMNRQFLTPRVARWKGIPVPLLKWFRVIPFSGIDHIEDVKPIKYNQVEFRKANEFFQLPSRALSGLYDRRTSLDSDSPTRIRNRYPNVNRFINIGLGLRDDGTCSSIPLDVPGDSFNRHVTVWGGSGSGKTRFVYHVLRQLIEDKKCIIFDIKGEFSHVLSGVFKVYKAGSQKNPLAINLFEIPRFVNKEDREDYITFIITWILKGMTTVSPTSAQMQKVARTLIRKAIKEKRSLKSFIENLDNTMLNESGLSGVDLGKTLDAIDNRLDIFRTGIMAQIFNVKKTSIDIPRIFEQNTIFDFSKIEKINDDAARKFIVDCVAQMIVFYLQSTKLAIQDNKEFSNVFIIDEVQEYIPLKKTGENTSPLAKMSAKIRSLGIGMLFSGTDPAEVEPAILVNNKICVMFDIRQNVRKIADILGITPEEYVRLKKITVGERKAILSFDEEVYPFRTPFVDFNEEVNKKNMGKLLKNELSKKVSKLRKLRFSAE